MTGPGGSGRARSSSSAGANELDAFSNAVASIWRAAAREVREVSSLGVLFEIEIEAFGPADAFDKPVQCLGGVPDLLGHRHHTVVRTEFGVGLFEDPRGPIKKILAREELIDKC